MADDVRTSALQGDLSFIEPDQQLAQAEALQRVARLLLQALRLAADMRLDVGQDRVSRHEG